MTMGPSGSASCFGEGLPGLMAVGLGRSTSSSPSLKNKNQSWSQGKSALVIWRRLGKVLLGTGQQGKASPCLQRLWKGTRRNPPQKTREPQQPEARPVGPSHVLWTTRIPWAPHTALGMGRGCRNHKPGQKPCSLWHAAEGQARLICCALRRKYRLVLAPTSCCDVGPWVAWYLPTEYKLG